MAEGVAPRVNANLLGQVRLPRGLPVAAACPVPPRELVALVRSSCRRSGRLALSRLASAPWQWLRAQCRSRVEW